MNEDFIYTIVIPVAIVLCLIVAAFVWKSERDVRIEKRINRITDKKQALAQKTIDAISLRRKQQEEVPFIGQIISKLPTQAMIKERLERAGIEMTSEMYVVLSGGGSLFLAILLLISGKSFFLSILAGIILGMVVPHLSIGYMGKKRIKKFLILFPDAIDFIVRGLRSGLPVTESMNIVGAEMEEPIGSIFANIGDSVKLGVPFDKALQDTARKLNSTEFNFFVTSIILQRETGGNLSEILSNLADVLRKRLMMRMKIKAMSSEAKASAIIVGALPFCVITALMFVSPGYLDPLFDTLKGNIIGVCCLCSMFFGIFVMIKMTTFEI